MKKITENKLISGRIDDIGRLLLSPSQMKSLNFVEGEEVSLDFNDEGIIIAKSLGYSLAYDRIKVMPKLRLWATFIIAVFVKTSSVSQRMTLSGELTFSPLRCFSGTYMPVPSDVEKLMPTITDLWASSAALCSLRYSSGGAVSKSKATGVAPFK